ncbi:conserved Plasmodium protein, unknown function [Plasmodium malariae]|uniref:Uncharacterized protein n=1 Tax=Plasmodium malariae TaxID=5858 RepID=A0A1D3PCZ9_PLAMA|nr:conserved Plasmodium protein, unknown function [Plasmodium malariae]SCN12875.1 conserved Plasmodium protein, unknown function [Plasmodium malariae]
MHECMFVLMYMYIHMCKIYREYIKSKLVKIDKIEETAKKMCVASNNKLMFLNTKKEVKKK